MRDPLTDLPHAIRFARQWPAFSAAIVVTLGLGIGVTAIFSCLDTLLMKPFPFKDPERLVLIAAARSARGGPLAYPELGDVRALTDIFESAAAYTDEGQYNASGDGRPEDLASTIATHDLLDVLACAGAGLDLACVA